MPYAPIGNLKIFYEVHGSGFPVVLLHHGFGSSKMWEKLIPGFTSGGFKVISYDRRGYGRSEGGKDFEDFYRSDSFRKYSVEELKKILEFLDVKECHIVSQCEGGVIGADFSTAYPDMVKSLVISSTMCFSKTTVEEFNRFHFPRKFEDLDEDIKKKMFKWHGEKAEKLYRLFSSYGGAYGRDFFDLRPVLAKVECPTLVIYPDRSPLFEVEQGVHMYRSLQRGELCVFPKCGHNTYEQKPKEYVREVLEFYKRLGY